MNKLALTLGMLTGLVLALSACDSHPSPSLATQSPSSPASGGNSSRDANSGAGTSIVNKDNGAEKQPAGVLIEPPKGPGWSDRLRSLASALPSSRMADKPRVGFWTEKGFSTEGEGIPAVSASYKSSSSDVVMSVKENTEIPSLLNIRFEQSAELTVIDAGKEIEIIYQGIVRKLDASGWARSEATIPSPEAVRTYPFWRREKITVYLEKHAGLILYAIEHDGKSEIGRGHSTSMGAQLIELYRERHRE